MAKRIRPEKCAFFHRVPKVGDFCLCDKENPFKRCKSVCGLYMSEQQYHEFIAQVLAEEKVRKE